MRPLQHVFRKGFRAACQQQEQINLNMLERKLGNNISAPLFVLPERIQAGLRMMDGWKEENKGN